MVPAEAQLWIIGARARIRIGERTDAGRAPGEGFGPPKALAPP